MVDAEEIAIEIGFSYLRGGRGKWEDAKGEIHKIDSLSRKYLDNCINFIDKGIKEIERGDLDEVIKKKIKMKSEEKKVSKECLKDVKAEMIKILQKKKKEIKET